MEAGLYYKQILLHSHDLTVTLFVCLLKTGYSLDG